MVVKVEVLYAPTCADHLMWLERVKELVDNLGEGVVMEETDVWEHPEAMKKYWSSVWPAFREGYIHYFTLVAVNGKVLDWYWDIGKVAEAVKREMEAEKK